VPVAHLQPKDYVRSVPPDSIAYSRAEALEYTRWLATHHYENFHVVSLLLPKELHQDFYNVYSYCRWADDLGDEIGDRRESLRLLAWWREELESMYRGAPGHPVFIALQHTVERYEIPFEPFDRLIRAFEQDQTVSRYQTFDDVFAYCANSANPVGRLVLYLCGYRDAQRQQLSDYTCTALQLANFWQDVTIDLLKDRIYLPLSLFEKYGYTESELRAHRFTPAFQSVMVDAVQVAQDLFSKGLPLIKMLDRRLALDIELFSRGGLRILGKIRQQGYDVLKRRPYISKPERLGILIRCLPRLLPL
jgi:squalene synthase HpnC